MTTVNPSQSFRLTDRPEREPNDMTNRRQMTATSIIRLLRYYLSNRETKTGNRCSYLVPRRYHRPRQHPLSRPADRPQRRY